MSTLLGDYNVPVKHEFDHAIIMIEDLWDAARRWAKDNGKQVVNSYGVVGEAPF